MMKNVRFDELMNGDLVINPRFCQVMQYAEFDDAYGDGRFLMTGDSMYDLWQFDETDYFHYDGTCDVGEFDYEFFDRSGSATGLYMAYGSNLNVEQMLMRCPGAKKIGGVMLKGYRLAYKGSKTGSYLTIEKCEGSSVPIGLWEINRNHEMALDMYEGYPRFYYKKKFTCKMNGEKKTCFAYIMDDNRGYGIPSKHYIDTCETGYKDFGFDKKYLDDALEFTKKEVA